MTHTDAALDAEVIHRFRAQGWVLIPGFFSAPEIAQIERFTDETCRLPEVSGAQMVYREVSSLDGAKIVQRIEDFCPHHAGFDALIRGARLQQAIERLWGAPAVLFKDKINFKMPGGSGFEPHQDQQAGWSKYAPLFLTAMVSIDPATVDNGCLEMTFGARTSGLIGREWTPLTTQEVPLAQFVAVPTEPGDVLFFDSFAPHASKPNRTQHPRRILYLTYNLASDGDRRAAYYADKRASFPPDVDRLPGVDYRYRV